MTINYLKIICTRHCIPGGSAKPGLTGSQHLNKKVLRGT